MNTTPQPPPAPADLPHGVTFFMSARERMEVLRRLRRHGSDRRLALLRVLGCRATDRCFERSVPNLTHRATRQAADYRRGT